MLSNESSIFSVVCFEKKLSRIKRNVARPQPSLRSLSENQPQKNEMGINTRTLYMYTPTVKSSLQTHLGVNLSHERKHCTPELNSASISDCSADLSVYEDKRNFIEPHRMKMNLERELIGRSDVKVIPRAFWIEGMESSHMEDFELPEAKRDSKREILKLLQRKRSYEKKQCI